MDETDKLDDGSEGERLVRRPDRRTSPMRKKQGIWVFRAGDTLSAAITDAALQDISEQRQREVVEL